MKPIGLTWIGTRTMAFDETVAFFRDVVGLPLGTVRPSFAQFDLPDGGALEVFRPGGADDHPYFTTGPVIGIQVDDFDLVLAEFKETGVELLGPGGGEVGGYRWQHFRAPDGGVYEIVDYPAREPGGSAVGRCRVTGFGWVGVRTPKYEPMREFVLHALKLPVEEDESDVVVFRFPNGDVFELFRPGSAIDHPHLTTGPMPGLVVQDLDRAEGELRSHQIEVLAKRRFGNAGWTHFRAPDGNVYEFKRFAD
jgi:hypothetical protein